MVVHVKKIFSLSITLLLFLSCFLLFYLDSKSNLTIDPTIEKMLGHLDIHNCYITEITDYSDISITVEFPEISDDDVQEYIEDLLKIYGQESLTLDFIKEQFDIHSIDSFYEYIFERVKNRKETDIIFQTRGKLLNLLISTSTFQLDDNAVATYSLSIIKSYEEEANLYDMPLDSYISEVLNISEDEFYYMCFNDGVKYIETYLVIGAIAEKESITVSKNDVELYAGSTIYSDEERAYVYYQVLYNKVYDLFVN